MKKKLSMILALMIAAVMILAACAPAAPVAIDPDDEETFTPVVEEEEEEEAPVEEDPVQQDPDEEDEVAAAPVGTGPGGVLTVAVNLINDDLLAGWTNPVGNSQMRELTLTGSSPIAWTRNSEFIANPTIVADLQTEENEDGSKTWTITINDGLLWSDGTPLTAEHYAFAWLFWHAPHFASGGIADENLGNTLWAGAREVVGADAWRTGEADTLAGVRLYDELTFSVTIDAYTDGEPNFPYFYEITYIDMEPQPMHVIAPGLSVEDTEDGVRVSGDGLTYELLRETVDNGVDGGIRYNPAPSAGPYVNAAPVDLDGEVIVLQINPYFQGTYDGTVPYIETIILRRVDNALIIPSMQQGEIDLTVGTSGAAILDGFELIDGGGYNYIAMPRNGSGGLFFHWDIGPTQFEEVRRAIAWTLDRHEFNNLWAHGHATTNDSLIAVASWMYQENANEIPNHITYNYTLNLANAVAELEAGGWVYTADGDEWTGPEDGPRHKDVDGELMPLVLEWASPEANIIGELLSSLMTEPAYSIGMHFEQTFVDGVTFGSALTGTDEDGIVIHGQQEHPLRFNMINGGLGINPVNAVWFSYNPDPEYWGNWNWTRTDDEELFSYAMGMRQSATHEEYLENWFGFISRFNVVLPVLPLNADTFHDFFIDGLENYYRNDLFSWARAIVWANLAEYPR